jgi:hypothetical protein
MLATAAPATDWARLIRAEYEEMPGLLLTCAQVGRMWGIDGITCHAAIDDLVRAGFLVPRTNGAYGRPTDLLVERLR